MLVITGVLLFMGMADENVNRVEGIILWVLFIIYLIYLFRMAKNGKQEQSTEKRSIGLLLVYAVIGGVVVVFGSTITVNAATALAEAAGITERFIGLTVVALGTSLPELVTSVTAARKGNADIAIGNIVGSNIFNILFVLGTSAIIIPLTFEAKFIIDAVISIGAGVLLWVSVVRKRLLTRPWGIIMLVAYAGYFVYLCLSKKIE
jgi:cation:H+ antiporter